MLKNLTFFVLLTGINLLTFAQTPAQPYIILITMDDMNTMMEGYEYFPQANTPNLNTLIQNGTVFTNANCSSPKCAPSRTSIVTGKDVLYTQVYDNTSYACYNFRKNFQVADGNGEVYTLPGYLKDIGDYYTYTIGKVFHCYEAFSDYDSITPNPCLKSLSWNNAFVYVEDDIINPIGNDVNEGIFTLKWAWLDDTLIDYMEDDVSVDAAIEFIDDFAAFGTDVTCGDPFFLGLGIKKPHANFYVPESFFNDDYVGDIYAEPFNKPYNEPYNAFPYNGLVMPPQPDPRWADYDSLGYMGQLFASDNEAELFDEYGESLITLPEIEEGISDAERMEIINETERANAILAYIAGINFLDYELGRFLTALQSHPEIYNNCVIILTSDHGFSLGTKRHWGKFSMWEPDVRVPLVFTDMRNPEAQTCAKSVSTLDIFPTLLDLLDLPEPTFAAGGRYLDGHSFLPLVNNPDLMWEKPSLSTVKSKNPVGMVNDASCFPQYSIRNNRFKYIKYQTNNVPPLLTCNEAASIREEELYDMGVNRETDPYEWNNLINDPAYAPVVNYMHQFLPDSALYLQKAFIVNIANAGTLPCFLKNNSKVKLQATLYDPEGVLLTGVGYTFKWTNNLTAAVFTGKNYNFNMLTVPPAVYSGSDRILFYLEVTETATGNLVAFNTKTYYINNANTPVGGFTLINDVPALTTSINTYSLSGSYTNTYWNFGDGNTSEEYLPDTHYYSAPGIYTVTNYIQYGNGCLKNYHRTANLLREGLPEFECVLYPNPANTQLNITLQNELQDAQIQILNTLGQVVFSETKNSQNKLIQLNIQNIPPGSYILEIRSEEVFTHSKFEIVR